MIKVIIPILVLAGAAIAVIIYCFCVAAGREDQLLEDLMKRKEGGKNDGNDKNNENQICG